MARATLDVGPAVDQAIPAAPAAVNNIGVVIVDRAGPVVVRGIIECHNGSAAARTYTAAIRKNGVQIASTLRQIEVATTLRAQVVVEHVDLAAVVGDAYTLEIAADTADPASVIVANRAHLLVAALGQDAAEVAGIGAVTP